MNLIRAAVFIAVLALPAAARAEDSAACKEAVAALNGFIDAQPRDCKIDSDCDGYYMRQTCTPPVVLPKAAMTGEFEKALLEKQDAARTACAEEWSRGPACSPIPFAAVCREGQCANAMNAPSPAPEEQKKP